MPFQICKARAMGMTPSPLVVLPTSQVMTDGVPDANVMHNVPLVNILPFGMCMSPAKATVGAATAAAVGGLMQHRHGEMTVQVP